MNANNPTKRPIKKLLTALLCTLVAVSLTTVAAAWFAGIWSSTVSFPVQTGGNPKLCSASMWMYTSAYEALFTDPTAEVGWKEFSFTPDNNSTNDTIEKTENDSGYIIPNIVYEFDENGKFVSAEADLVNVHFGRIDNLEDLSEDNRIYFRFELKKAVHGDEILAFYFDYADYGTNSEDPDPRNSIKIYDSKGELVSNENGLQKDTVEQMQLLELTYCVSNTPVAPGTEAFNALTFNGPIPIMNSEAVSPSGATTVTLPTDLAETYYLYVCMSPKLENFGLHENILEFFAQSYMLFNVNFSFEVH